MKWGKSHASIPSRFLLEMRGETERAQRAAQAAEQRFRPATQHPRGASATSSGKAPKRSKALGKAGSERRAGAAR